MTFHFPSSHSLVLAYMKEKADNCKIPLSLAPTFPIGCLVVIFTKQVVPFVLLNLIQFCDLAFVNLC